MEEKKTNNEYQENGKINYKVKPEIEGSNFSWFYVCGRCHSQINWNDHQCPTCKAGVDWNV